MCQLYIYERKKKFLVFSLSREGVSLFDKAPRNDENVSHFLEKVLHYYLKFSRWFEKELRIYERVSSYYENVSRLFDKVPRHYEKFARLFE